MDILWGGQEGEWTEIASKRANEKNAASYMRGVESVTAIIPEPYIKRQQQQFQWMNVKASVCPGMHILDQVSRSGQLSLQLPRGANRAHRR